MLMIFLLAAPTDVPNVFKKKKVEIRTLLHFGSIVNATVVVFVAQFDLSTCKGKSRVPLQYNRRNNEKCQKR